MAAVRKRSTMWLWQRAQLVALELRIPKQKQRSICRAQNRGDKKGRDAPAPVTLPRRSGAAVESCLDRSHAIIPKKFRNRSGGSPCRKRSASESKPETF